MWVGILDTLRHACKEQLLYVCVWVGGWGGGLKQVVLGDINNL